MAFVVDLLRGLVSDVKEHQIAVGEVPGQPVGGHDERGARLGRRRAWGGQGEAGQKKQ